ncbi:disulfide bond formation protein DsbA [Streptomyces sp. CS149]|uniref:DsbA family protein n=1 Tax=Streptomyces TaxID=1883 RepID=UPI000D1AC0C5|nr:DsbA family protein [Streptomyces sp. CS149]PSK71849.1 disulfide bond formation protein DsbA [Streptomyces sp. CS149]
MRIEIWADVVCAWAYIGKRRLERALADRDDVEVVWRPFRIDPTAPARAIPLEEALRDPLMDEAVRACAPDLTPAENRVRISTVAAAEGLGPRWGAGWRASSHDAHRLVALAYDHGGATLQNEVMERVLHATFIEALDISDRSVLARIAAAAGFPQGAGLLDTDAGEVRVRELLLEGKARGVKTSPSLVVGDRALAGAQAPEAIREFLDGCGGAAEVPAEVARMRWAESLMDLRDPLGALTLLRPLLEEFAGDRAVRTLAARAYFASAQLKRAEAQLAPLVEEYPDDAFARLLYGRTLQRQNRSEEAEPHMRLAEAASA